MGGRLASPQQLNSLGNEELAEGPHLHEQAAGSFEHPWNLPIFNSSSTPSLRAQSSAGSGSHMSVRDMLGGAAPKSAGLEPRDRNDNEMLSKLDGKKKQAV